MGLSSNNNHMTAGGGAYYTCNPGGYGTDSPPGQAEQAAMAHAGAYSELDLKKINRL